VSALIARGEVPVRRDRGSNAASPSARYLWGARTRPWGLSWGLSGGSLVLDEEAPRVARCLRQRQMSASHSLSGSSPVN